MQHPNGSRLKGYEISVENDELIVWEEDTQKDFQYKIGQAGKPFQELQLVQETLFHEKRTIIENCLFGVDINPKSVSICQLRLWIELLKNAFYTPESKYLYLETLPNIDINIKTGNSLVSKYSLTEDLSEVFKKQKFSIDAYRTSVHAYKEENSKTAKAELQKFINEIKEQFKETVKNTDPRRKKLSELRGKRSLLDLNVDMFGNKSLNDDQLDLQKRKFDKLIQELDSEITDVANAKIYRNSFEWRFEFPEILNENGDFMGFDVIIGNPPYGDLFDEKNKDYIKKNYESYQYKFDAYIYFIELTLKISSEFGITSLITPELWLNLENAGKLRSLLSVKTFLYQINVWGENVFSDAVINTVSLFHQKKTPTNTIELKIKDKSFELGYPAWIGDEGKRIQYKIPPVIQKIIAKIKHISKPLNDFGEVIQGLTPYDSYRGQSKELIKNRAYHSPLKIDDTYGKWLDGKNIERYVKSWNGEWLSYGNWLAAPREKRFFERERILFREVSGANKRIQACFVDEIVYHGHSISPFKPYSSSLKYINYFVGIANSSLISFYCQKTSPNFGKDIFPKLNPSDIKQIPIVYPTELQNQIITEKVNQILTLKKEDPKADTSKLEAEIDRMVYDLYELTEEEITIVEGK